MKKFLNNINKWKMENGKWKIQQGVTIVELLVYMGLMSIFMLVLVDVFVTILNARLSSQSTSALDADSRYILARLSYDVGNADSVTTPASLGGTASTFTFVISGVSYTYALDGSNNLTLNGTKLNGLDTTLTNLSFTKIGNPDATCTPSTCKPTIKVSYTIKSQIVKEGGVQESQTVDTTLGLR